MDSAILIKDMILDAWDNKVAQATKLFDALADGPVERELVSGGNKIIYITGHLIVASDKLFEVMDLGERRYPELDALFYTAQDPDQEYPAYNLLWQSWKTVNRELSDRLHLLTLTQWMAKQHYATDANFGFDPKRNRLHVLLSRTGHLAYHIGQLALCKHLQHEGRKLNIQTDCDYI